MYLGKEIGRKSVPALKTVGGMIDLEREAIDDSRRRLRGTLLLAGGPRGRCRHIGHAPDNVWSYLGKEAGRISSSATTSGENGSRVLICLRIFLPVALWIFQEISFNNILHLVAARINGPSLIS